MSRQLLLMRHGKSDWSREVDDFDRPLKKRGKRGAQRMGAWLKAQNILPDFIVSSPAERAYNTAAKLTKAMGLTVQDIAIDERIYEANLEQLQAVLADCPKAAKRVLVIGHNPGLEDLLYYLQAGQLAVSENGKLLATATLALLEMPDNWKALKKGSAKVVSITRASKLAKSFPFNGLLGLEQRQRPAYYYSQSAVIPYRIVDNEIQILLVSASSKNHWLVPKGIIEPGCSASASAAIEAWEEAGVEGVVSEQMLGFYQYEKWGMLCTVQVFPLAVTHMLADKDWQESQRDRQWLTVKKAATLIDQIALTELVLALAQQLKARQG